jgi:hypothetical protein
MVLGLLLLGGAIGANAAGAESPEVRRKTPHPSRVAELEIVESGPGKTVQTARWRMGLTEGSPSEVETRAAGIAYRVKLRWDSTAGQSGVLFCDIKRTDARNDGRNLQVTVSGVVEAGRRVILARVVGVSGRVLEISATSF